MSYFFWVIIGVLVIGLICLGYGINEYLSAKQSQSGAEFIFIGTLVLVFDLFLYVVYFLINLFTG